LRVYSFDARTLLAQTWTIFRVGAFIVALIRGAR
jgi:hypothetical protein